MANYIINNKKIVLVRNREFTFKIPVLFNPVECSFLIEMDLMDISDKPLVTFILRSMKSNRSVQVPVQLTGIYTMQSLYQLNNELTEDYLLVSCLSSQNATILLSVERNRSQAY